MSRKTIAEPARQLPVKGEFDVVVVGGGIAGVAAALAAARAGASTALLEKEFGLGGLATLGNVVIYLPLCDGRGTQVSKGLAEELLKLSWQGGSAAVAPGARPFPACWQPGGDKKKRATERYQVAFNPAEYALAMEQALLKAGVKLLYDTRFCAVAKKGRRIEAVIVENKGGRSALGARTVIDASGDADVCAAADETLDSCPLNVACGWFYYLDENRKVELAPLTEPFDVRYEKLLKGVKRGYRGDDGDEVTAMHLASNRLMMKRLEQLRKERKNPQLYMLRPPSIPSFRTTRRLVGPYELREQDDRVYFPDTVGMIGHWRLRGPIYCIPYRSLYAAKTENLITAGRCMSAARDAWDMTRVIPACAVTGEAAGVAAALAAPRRKAFAKIDVTELRRRLKLKRVLLDPKLVARVGEVRDEGNTPAWH